MQSHKEPVPQNQPADSRGRSGMCPRTGPDERHQTQPDPPIRHAPAGQPGDQADRLDAHVESSRETCPECASPLSHESACVICHACGYSQCG